MKLSERALKRILHPIVRRGGGTAWRMRMTLARAISRNGTFGASLTVGAVSFLAVLVPAKVARADTYYVEERGSRAYYTAFNLGFDLEGVADLTPPSVNSGSVEGGSGFKLRFGAEIHRRFLRIIPEGGFSYTHLFVTDNAGESVGWNMERAFVGVRLGFGEVVVPLIYGHVGYGWRGTTGGPLDPVPTANGVAADVGVGLDFHIIRHFGFGLHLEYVAVDAAPFVPDWLAFGLHGDVVF
jgi:hypothetical protein